MIKSFEKYSFFRGVSDSYPLEHPSVLRPRRDRRPRNSSIEFHILADRWFLRRFGVSYRSQSLLVTSSLEMAAGYAASNKHVMRVLPISEYRFCWSPSISDLLYVGVSLSSVTEEAIFEMLDDASYREYGLEDAHASGHELMLFCDEYVSLPIELLGISVADLKPGIILPA